MRILVRVGRTNFLSGDNRYDGGTKRAPFSLFSDIEKQSEKGDAEANEAVRLRAHSCNRSGSFSLVEIQKFLRYD